MSYLTSNWALEPLANELVNGLFDSNRRLAFEDHNLIIPTKKDGIITLKYKVPGYEKNEIKIDLNQSLSNGVDRYLTVKATNREYGTTMYKSYIPKNIDEKLTKANLKNGILTLTFVEEKIKSPLANLKIEVD